MVSSLINDLLMSKIKLHLGCGERNFGPDWVHIDGNMDPPHIEHSRIDKLEYKDDQVDLIYASHVIEYFDREEVVDILKEWHRVLVPGGTLRIAVPDFEAMANGYLWKDVELSPLLGPLYGKIKFEIITRPDYNSNEVLLRCGFKRPGRYNWRCTEHSDHDDHSQAYLPHMDKDNGTLISLNVECEK